MNFRNLCLLKSFQNGVRRNFLFVQPLRKNLPLSRLDSERESKKIVPPILISRIHKLAPPTRLLDKRKTRSESKDMTIQLHRCANLSER